MEEVASKKDLPKKVLFFNTKQKKAEESKSDAPKSGAGKPPTQPQSDKKERIDPEPPKTKKSAAGAAATPGNPNIAEISTSCIEFVRFLC